MNFTVNRDGVIVSATSGREIIGSKVKDELGLLDFVVIKRENNDRQIKWGLYGGTFDGNDAIVRTLESDDVVPLSILTPITPSETLINNMVERVDGLINSGMTNNVVKFFLNYIYIYHRDKYEDINVPVCSICGAPFPTRTYRHQSICNECYENRFITCRRCGNAIDRADAIDGECESCHQRHYILPYHHDQPRLKFYGDNHDNTVPYMGVELEVAYGGHSDENVGIVLPLINTREDIFMYCMHDSSLDNGFENITQPATLEYHKSIKDKYMAYFAKLRELGYLSHDTPCCGFHVHVNRDYFDGYDETAVLENILYINEKFWDELLKFSRRVKQKMEYCRRFDDEYSIPEFVEDSNRSGSSTWHHYVINYANENTIEFRIFRGTLNIETFYATLELVQSICNAAKDLTRDEIDALSFEDLLEGYDEAISYWNRINHVDREM